MALLVGMPLSAAAKCRGPGPAGKPLLVLDGRQTSEAAELVTDLVQGVPACFLSIDPRAKHALESEG